MQKTVIIEKVKTYIADNILGHKDIGLDEATPLLEWGIINSLEIVRILSFIQQEFGVNIPLEKLTAEHFTNIPSIANLIIEQKSV